MPENDVKAKAAMEVGDMIHSAAGIVEQAMRIEDPASKKALKDAAKQLLKTAIARLDEETGAAKAEEEDED